VREFAQVLRASVVPSAIMGDLISLAEHRLTRCAGPSTEPVPATPRTPRITFCFDLSSPFTYLAAERVDRLFSGVVWRPVAGEVLAGAPVDPRIAEERAAALGLPLVWPEDGACSPRRVRPAMRIASLAAQEGRAAPFVLAASRLAFCGGFELDHPEVLAEAAAAAGLGLEECLQAAGDTGRDARMEEAARTLLAQGARRLPALRVGRLLFEGEDRIGEARTAAQAPTARAV
jgi:2-hydroxychromene-2-carboxylate isomerase